MTRPTPPPGGDGSGRGPASGAGQVGRQAAKQSAEGAVGAATGGVGKVALALLPHPLDSPEDKKKKRRRRRIIYAIIALVMAAIITFVSIVAMSMATMLVGGGVVAQSPTSAGECLDVSAESGQPDAPRPSRGNGQMGYPVDPDVPITSRFGPRWGTIHDGLDFGAPIGTPIYAVADGVVTRAGPIGGYGNWVTIEHDIDGEIVESLYGHMPDNGVHVEEGEEVEAGQHIADIGNEGYSTGPHLHFGVYPGGWSEEGAVDPEPWLDQLREQSPDPADDDGDSSAGEARAQPVSRNSDDQEQPPGTVTAADWEKLAECESGGNWSTDTGNGYSGGLQFAPQTWDAFGGTEYAPQAAQATREQQMEIANKVLEEQGWGAWPACSNDKYPELKELSPAPEGTFVQDRDGDNQGGDFEDGLNHIVSTADDAGITVGAAVGPTSGGDQITAGAATTDEYAASTIKVGVAAAVAKNLRQDDEVQVEDKHVVGGAGVDLTAGTYPVSRLQEVMITDSDNTATNALIDHLGGFDAVNDVIAEAGVTSGYRLHNYMMAELGSTRSEVSASGAAQFLQALWDSSTGEGGFITSEEADRIIDLMKRQNLRSKLPATIPDDAVANKTGENTGVSHDIGYIWPESGGPVAVAVTTSFSGGDSDAVSTIADIGDLIYHEYDTAGSSGGGDDSDGSELPPTPPEIGSEERLQVDAVRGMRTVVDQFPEVKSIGGWRDDGRSDDHPSGRAIDAMVTMDPEGEQLGDDIAQFFIDNADEYNVVSIIWQQRYWEGGEWSQMEDRLDPTENHMDHVHISFAGNGAPSDDTVYTAPDSGRDDGGREQIQRAESDSDALSMNLTPEQQSIVKMLIIKAKESGLDESHQPRAAELATMLSGHQANLINMDAEDNANKVGIFAQAPFGGQTERRLMDPAWTAEKFMDRLEDIAEERDSWHTDPGEEVLIDMYPERAALAQELQRWEGLAAEIVAQLWDDENAEAGMLLERLPEDAESCTVGAGQPLNAGEVPPEYVKWIELGAEVCESIDAPLLAAQIDAESGFNKDAVSEVGAQGPSQFMPYTWPAWGSPRGEDGQPTGPTGTGDPFKISDAVMAQADFMCSLGDQISGWIDEGRVQGDVMELTIAGYNAGPGAVLNAGGMPSGGDYTTQTQPYVAKIMAGREKFAGVGETRSSTSTRGNRPSRSRAASADDIGAQALEAARKYEGVPYLWGGKTAKALDCSGLISIAFADIGYMVLDGTGEQVEIGEEIPLEEARPGDIVFSNYTGSFPQHVAFVVEPGESYYEAPEKGKPVSEYQRWPADSVVKRWTEEDLPPIAGAD